MAAKKRRRFGSVFRRKRSNGTLYSGFYVRYTDAWGGRHQEYGGRNKSEAEAYLRKKGTERDAARLSGERQVGNVTLEALAPALLRHWEATLRPATVAGRRGFIRDAAKHFGKRALASITTGDVQQLLDTFSRRKGLRAATTRHHAAVLSSAFQYAVTVGAPSVPTWLRHRPHG